MTSKAAFGTIVGTFAGLNLCYWTLWVILRRTALIEATTYTYIVSISYTTCALLLSVVITIVLVFDIVFSSKKEGADKRSSNRRYSSRVPEVSSPTSPGVVSEIMTEKPKLNFVNKFSTGINWFIYLDGPLYFRMEMVLYVISFVFLILNQVIGLSTLSYRNHDTALYNQALLLDAISFIFEVIYVLSYLMVFGGYALCVTIHYKWRNYKRKHEREYLLKKKNEQQELMDKDLYEVLDSEEGYAIFEENLALKICSSFQISNQIKKL
jgi:hypothetical protein